MSEKEKQRFHQMAEKDKKRYDSEMATYKPAKGDKGGKGKKRKRTKDPDAPKRSLSAFFWFCNDERPKVKESMPDSGVGEIAKELGRRWNDVSADTKSKYEALAAKDKARYEKDMKNYKSKKGKGSPSKVKKTDSDESGEEEEEENVEEDEEEEEEDDDD